MRNKTALFVLVAGMVLVLAFLAFTALAGSNGTGTATATPIISPTNGIVATAGPSVSPEITGSGADVKIGQALYAAHGKNAFCVATVAMNGNIITDAMLDEFQFVDPATFTNPVPNSDAFKNADGYVLASKRANNDAYSALMTEKGKATQSLLASYQAIEAFVTGKTISDLETLVAEKTAPEMVDAVSGSTLQDTLGYLQALIAAGKAAQ